MLFKFSSPDVCNTNVIDCSSGAVVFRITTSIRGNRARSLSSSSVCSLSTSSKERLEPATQRITVIQDGKSGNVLAEITWRGNTASSIVIGDETLAGTGELFDAAYVEVLPDETLLPTRMEYTWRTTLESLTLLDDDDDVVGKLYPNCLAIEGELIPSTKSKCGHDYLELVSIAPIDLAEIFVGYILVSALRERLYWIANYVYGQKLAQRPQSPLQKLRRQASRSFANLRDSLFRSRHH